MKRVLVRSAYDAFDYVMEHYSPAGQEELAERSDSYCVISIQDSLNGGFGFEFRPNAFCRAVLTLQFDDIERPVEGAVLFTEEQAGKIIKFIRENQEAETLLVHCYGGESRSRAVGAFAVRMLGGDNTSYFETGHPNEHVYETLEAFWIDSLMGYTVGL